MDERQKEPNYRMVGHHEGLWMLKVWFFFFFSIFGCFCWLASYLCLMFCFSMEWHYLSGFGDGAGFLLFVQLLFNGSVYHALWRWLVGSFNATDEGTRGDLDKWMFQAKEGTNTKELSFLLMFKCDFMGVCGVLLE